MATHPEFYAWRMLRQLSRGFMKNPEPLETRQMCGSGYFGDATVLAGHTDFFLGYRAASASTQVPWVVGKNVPDTWLGAVDLTDNQMHDWNIIHCLALDIHFWVAPTGAHEHTVSRF